MADGELMPIIEIDGVGRIEVDEGFTRLSPQQQQAAVNSIAQQARGGRATTGTISGATGQERVGVTEALGTGFARGASLGGIDEMAGVAAGQGVPEWMRNTPGLQQAIADQPPQTRRFTDVLMSGVTPDQRQEQGRTMVRGDMERARRDQPIAATVGEVAGGVATGIVAPGAGLTATTIPRAIGQGIAVGAGYGGVQGFLEGEGNFLNRALSAGEGAVVGGAAGGVVGGAVHGVQRVVRGRQASGIADDAGQLTERGREVVRAAGLDPDAITPDAVRAFQAQMARSGPGEEAARAATLGEFNVPPTRANLTGDVVDWRNQTRSAFDGGPVRDRVGAQREAFEGARDTVGRGMAGGEELATNAGQAGGRVLEGVRSRAAAAGEARDAAYDAFRGMDAAVDPNSLRIAPDFVSRTIQAGDNPTILSQQLHPAASAMMDRLRTVAGSVPADAVEYSIQGAAQLRRELVMLRRAARGEDMRAASAVMSAFDDWLETAVARTLTRGDDSALAALREANRQHAVFRRSFGPQGPQDDAGRFIQRMVDQGDLTQQEVANALFGVAQAGERGLSVRLATRLRDLLGGDSSEWNSIRQAMWFRLTSRPGDVLDPSNLNAGVTALDPARQVANIQRFLGGEGSAMANVLFSRSERELMNRYARATQYTVAPGDAVNPSRSGLFAAESARAAARSLMAALGFSQGGVIGAAAGAVLGDVGSNLGRSARASRALTEPRAAGRVVGPAGGLAGTDVVQNYNASGVGPGNPPRASR
jgi:hypothetical protein